MVDCNKKVFRVTEMFVPFTWEELGIAVIIGFIGLLWCVLFLWLFTDFKFSMLRGVKKNEDFNVSHL